MKIHFLGASRTVTGSCYLVETEKTKFIIDCGMFQGKEVEHYNYEKFKFDPATIDFVVLTHTHIDHSGLLPKLTRFGFRGKIYSSIPSRRLAEILLFDSAKIQDSNLKAYHKTNKLQNTPSLVDSYGQLAEFIYSTPDASKTLDLFEPTELNTEVVVGENIKMRIVDAGHVLGAVSVQFWITEDGKEKKMLFAGDIGHRGQGLVKVFSPSLGFDPDYVVMESLYGGLVHTNRTDTVNELIDIINKTSAKGGNTIIPSFAVQRTQEILFELKKAKMEGKIKNDLEIFVDSPLAIKSTMIYRSSWKYLNNEIQLMFGKGDNAFDFPNLQMTTTQRESMSINKKKGCVIIAGSGMCDGGRVLYHLNANLANPSTSVVLVGFQAEDTLGRELMEGVREVSIADRKVKVNGTIHKLLGFSGHADDPDLQDYFKQYNTQNLKKVFLVHSEIDRSTVFKGEIDDINTGAEYIIPSMFESYDL